MSDVKKERRYRGPSLSLKNDDSNEPTTETWLRSVGFVDCPNDDFIHSQQSNYGAMVVVKIHPGLSNTGSNGTVLVGCENTEHYSSSNTAAVGKDWNRGQVRRLASALGIPITESTNAK